MSILSKVKSGVQKTAYLNCLYGPPGVGKTYFMTRFPNMLVIDIESGSKNLDLQRLSTEDVPDYEALVATVKELMTSEHSYTNIAIDSVTSLEYYINKQVCIENGGVKDLSEIPFGKGTHLAVQKLQEFLVLLNELKNKRQIDIWLIAHSKVMKFSDPTLMSQFDRFSIQAGDKFGGEIIRQCDNVYFVKYEVEVSVDKTTKKAKGFGDGSIRMMHTRFNAAFEAKTRCNLPEAMIFDYEVYVQALANYGPKPSSELVKDIQALMIKLNERDPELVTLAKQKLTDAAEDFDKLQKIKGKLLDAAKAF